VVPHVNPVPGVMESVTVLVKDAPAPAEPEPEVESKSVEVDATPDAKEVEPAVSQDIDSLPTFSQCRFTPTQG